MNRILFVLVVITLLLLAAVCFAQPHQHIHGVTVPDWYDPDCCDRRDCFPVEDSKDLEFLQLGGIPAIRYKKTYMFMQNSTKWRKSQDERFHVCIYNTTPLCVYIPAMG